MGGEFNMQYYDEYVSLGGNCEIGFQFRRYGKEPSSLFTWLVSDIDKIINVLSSDFENFYEFEDLVPYAHDMVKSMQSGFAFHSRMHSKYNLVKKKFEFINDENTRREFFQKEKSKYNYLIEKWNKLSQSNLRVVYFIKDTFSYTESQILKLEQVILEKNPNHKFKLVVIREGNTKERKSLSKNVDICHLNFFSDKKYPAVQIIDLAAWDMIYSYYPLKERIVENMDWIRQECRFLKNDNYSLSMNYNLSQFYEKVDFLDTAKYFITLAKEQSSEKFIEEEYSRINRKIESRILKEKDRDNQHITTIYSIDNEKDMKSYFIEHDLLAWKYDNKPLEIQVNREARYIRLSLQETVCFHLDEIEVYNLKNENIALNKYLMMSSTYKQEKPLLNQNALNGKIKGKPSFHTKTEKNPWVLLDLENYEQITYINIFNRQGEYASRALSILVEVSNDLKEWTTVFDNFKIFKILNNNVLSNNQQNILEKIKNSKANVINSESIELVLKSLLNLSGTDRGMDISKIIKYALLLQFKAYYQIKVDVSKSTSPKNELIIVNSVLRTFYGNKLVFSLEKGLKKRIFYNNGLSSISNNIKEKVVDFLNILEKYNVNSEKYNIIKYAILSKYKAISRLTGELKQSKNQEHTNSLITKGIELIYGKGYVLTQHGIRKNIDTKL